MSQRLKFWSNNRHINDDKSPQLCKRLPDELLRIVVEYVDSEADLLSLSRTSRMLQHEAKRRLYTNLEVYFTRWRPRSRDSDFRLFSASQQIRLYRTLEIPRLGWTVTSMEAELPHCHRAFRADGFFRRNPYRCQCSKVNFMLGKALQTMQNLSKLWIYCHTYHYYDGVQRHPYLKELQANHLLELRFSCLCLGSFVDDTLLSRVLDSVHTLEWNVSSQDLTHFASKAGSILPCVRKLPNASSQLLNLLLPGSPLTHVQTDFWDAQHHRLAKESRFCGSLQQLLLNSRFEVSMLNDSILPYRNIFRIGRFHDMLISVEEFHDRLVQLSKLPKLFILDIEEVSSTEPEWESKWNVGFLQSLHLHLQKLERVNVTSIGLDAHKVFYIKCHVWEYGGDDQVWTCREVPSLSRTLEGC